ncbi:unnamed protein product [Cyclocybe aegerita]|uniref:Uncharacterized protein n=1 Tax=Cyclocybe aegerita TaxID=1973307 RepID=A0A8S0XGW7_CYCAE|nr:unnamed protein product [Cyclocybe aegerita]
MHSSCLQLAYTPVEQWRPLPLPTDGHLELTLCDRIHGGSSGTTYFADVVSSTATGMPQRVVVKFARQCRTLAREAWFYEQLSRESNCEGVITPRCYGFFIGSRKDWGIPHERDQCSDFVFKPTHNPPSSKSPPLWYDLADDEMFNPDFWLYFCDDAGLKRGSEWDTFDDGDNDGDIVAILILEVLGDFYPAPMIDEEALRYVVPLLRNKTVFEAEYSTATSEE